MFAVQPQSWHCVTLLSKVLVAECWSSRVTWFCVRIKLYYLSSGAGSPRSKKNSSSIFRQIQPRPIGRVIIPVNCLPETFVMKRWPSRKCNFQEIPLDVKLTLPVWVWKQQLFHVLLFTFAHHDVFRRWGLLPSILMMIPSKANLPPPGQARSHTSAWICSGP